MNNLTKQDLSPARQQLIEMMQRLNFGRIEHLEVRHGEPVVQPAPFATQSIKIGAESGPAVQIHLKNFQLRDSHLHLLQHLDAIGNGVIDELEVRHGIPQQLKIKRSLAV